MGRAIVFHASTKGGSNNLVYVIKGGWPLFFMQSCWGQGVNVEFLCSHSHSCVNIIWNTSFV